MDSIQSQVSSIITTRQADIVETKFNQPSVEEMQRAVDIAVSEFGLTHNDFIIELTEDEGHVRVRPRASLDVWSEERNWRTREIVFLQLSKMGFDYHRRRSPMCWKCWEINNLKPWECPAEQYLMRSHNE